MTPDAIITTLPDGIEPASQALDLPLNVEPAGTWKPGQPFRARKSVPHTISGAVSMLRSAARRDDFDVPDLAALAAARDALDAILVDAAANLRRQGHSFTVIARPLGISRQAARQRFGG